MHAKRSLHLDRDQCQWVMVLPPRSAYPETMRGLFLLVLLALAACGRPLTPGEMAFTAALQGDGPHISAARLSDGLATGAPRTISAPPRLTCQQRIYPPPSGDTIRVGTQAMVIFNDIYLRREVYLDDLMSQYPAKVYLPDAMLLAHEMVHVWQWENRDQTNYHPLKAAFEHFGGRDPYLFDPETTAPFQSFAFEQQGAIMEEYVCCKALAPNADRTRRLHDMLAEVFELPPLEAPLAAEIYLPWRGVEVEGICDGPA